MAVRRVNRSGESMHLIKDFRGDCFNSVSWNRRIIGSEKNFCIF